MKNSYKILEPTQTVREGDEWFDEEDGKWKPVLTSVGKRICNNLLKHTYRRKVKDANEDS